MLHLRVLLILLLMTQISVGQDILSLSPLSMPLKRNVTFTQGDTCSQVNLAHRTKEFFGPATILSYQAAFGTYVSKTNGYITGYGQHLRTGTLKDQLYSVAVGYVQNIKLNNEIGLRIGASIGYLQRSFDWNRLWFGGGTQRTVLGGDFSTNDVFRGGSSTALDISSGVSFYWKRFVLGANLMHLNQPNIAVVVGESPLATASTLQASYEIIIGQRNKVRLFPIVEYFDQRSSQVLTFGGLLDAFGAQVGFMTELENNSHSATLGYTLKRVGLRLNYAANFFTSKLTTNPATSHEIALGFRFGKRLAHKNFTPFSGVYF